MSTDTLIQSLFSLPVEQRIDLADRLYASIPEDWQKSVDQAWLEEALRRDAEMDADPSMALSYDEALTCLRTVQPTNESLLGE